MPTYFSLTVISDEQQAEQEHKLFEKANGYTKGERQGRGLKCKMILRFKG